MFARGAAEKEINCTGAISELSFPSNHITSEGIKHLLCIPKQLINTLHVLSAGDNKLDSASCATLACLIPYMPHLKILNLSNNHNIGPGGTVPLIKSLIAHNSLEELDLVNTRIGVEDCQALSQLLSSSTSLKNIDIRVNDLPMEAVLIIYEHDHNNIVKL